VAYRMLALALDGVRVYVEPFPPGQPPVTDLLGPAGDVSEAAAAASRVGALDCSSERIPLVPGGVVAVPVAAEAPALRPHAGARDARATVDAPPGATPASAVATPGHPGDVHASLHREMAVRRRQ
jgi:hypothetical protein